MSPCPCRWSLWSVDTTMRSPRWKEPRLFTAPTSAYRFHTTAFTISLARSLDCRQRKSPHGPQHLYYLSPEFGRLTFPPERGLFQRPALTQRFATKWAEWICYCINGPRLLSLAHGVVSLKLKGKKVTFYHYINKWTSLLLDCCVTQPNGLKYDFLMS